jgi:6-phosphogluconate dehydrogenase
MRAQRQIAAERFPSEASEVVVNKEAMLKQLEAALYSTFIVCYAQGFQMLANASEEYKYNINLTDVASIWRGGCIIRAAMLVKIKEAYEADAGLKNIMLNDFFATELNDAKESFKTVGSLAFAAGIPIPALSSALNYYLSYHSGWLPANLIQAQRDFFGAHTYQRNDREGTFHTNWNQTIH